MSFSELHGELRLQLTSRYVLLAGLLTALAGVLSARNLIVHTNSLHEQFVRSLSDSEQQGVSLAEALAQPVVVQETTGQTYVENVLRFDFEAAATAVHSLGVIGFMTNYLQFVSFVVMPVIAFILGCSVLSRDARQKTLKARVFRVGRLRLHGTQVGATVVTAVASILVGLPAAAVSGYVFAASSLEDVDERVLAAPASGVPAAEWLSTLALVVLSTTFFVLVGAAVGIALRTVLAPSLVFVAWNLAIPIMSPWDLRVAWATLGDQVFDFPGVFTLSVPYAVSSSLAVGYILLVVLAAGLCAVYAARRRTAYT